MIKSCWRNQAVKSPSDFASVWANIINPAAPFRTSVPWRLLERGGRERGGRDVEQIESVRLVSDRSYYPLGWGSLVLKVIPYRPTFCA